MLVEVMAWLDDSLQVATMTDRLTMVLCQCTSTMPHSPGGAVIAWLQWRVGREMGSRERKKGKREGRGGGRRRGGGRKRVGRRVGRGGERRVGRTVGRRGGKSHDGR